jgi:hypothetical protein
MQRLRLRGACACSYLQNLLQMQGVSEVAAKGCCSSFAAAVLAKRT